MNIAFRLDLDLVQYMLRIRFAVRRANEYYCRRGGNYNSIMCRIINCHDQLDRKVELQ